MVVALETESHPLAAIK